jgi:predicted nucleic acid-binding protein
VRELVLDASVVLKWFHSEGEPNVEAARVLRLAYEAGELLVFAPALLYLEILNVAGRRWRLDEKALFALVDALETFGFEILEPPLERIARWVARGLTAYDAAYVALAESAGVMLVSDDAVILELAGDVAEPLAT